MISPNPETERSTQHLQNKSFDKDNQILAFEMLGYDGSNPVRLATDSDGKIKIDTATSPFLLLDQTTPQTISDSIRVDLGNNKIARLNDDSSASAIWGINMGLIGEDGEAKMCAVGSNPFTFYTGATRNSMVQGTKIAELTSSELTIEGATLTINNGGATNSYLNIKGYSTITSETGKWMKFDTPGSTLYLNNTSYGQPVQVGKSGQSTPLNVYGDIFCSEDLTDGTKSISVAEIKDGIDSLSEYIYSTPTTSARNVIQPSAADIVPLTLKGYASQSANLLQLSDSSDNSVAYINPIGRANFFNFRTLSAETGGDDCVFVGDEVAGAGNSTGVENLFIGTTAGHDNTSGYQHIYIGKGSGYKSSTGYNNICIGRDAGFNIFSGRENVFIGTNVQRSGGDNCQQNVAIGVGAATKLSGALYNTVIGYIAGQNSTTASMNVSIGYAAGGDGTTGGNNTMVGMRAGRQNRTGVHNSLFGSDAGEGTDNNSFSYNSIFGSQAGSGLTTGSSNVLIGYDVGSNLTTESNKLYIDNSDTSTPLIYGEFDNDIVKINGALSQVGDSTNYTEIKSDGEINLHGTARVYKNEWVKPSGFAVPGTKPAIQVDWGISFGWEFTDGTDDTIYATVRCPQDMDRTVAPEFKIGWASATADPGDDSKQVVWQVEYLWVAQNESTVAAAQETLTATTSASTVANGLTITTITGVDLPGDGDQLLFLRIKRLGDDGDDDLGDDCTLVGFGMKYASDKLGVAT